MNENTLHLADRWAALLSNEPNMRIRNAAEKLGVSEAELLATKAGDSVTRLKPEFKAILGEVESLGTVTALTRNNDVVHERKGVYLNPTMDNPHVGLFVGDDIDLRIFFMPWKYAFAVKETANEKPRYSLQFFASDGEAIHKIYLTGESNLNAYHSLVAKYTSDDQSTSIEVKPWPAEAAEKPDAEIDAAAFREAWVNLKDTHDFYPLLKRFGVTRTQALRLAPEGNYAVMIDNSSLRPLLEKVAESDLSIMVFVGNKGMIQIHTGPVKKLMEHGEWYNVLDPDFNLHIRENAIAQSWVVRKPTVDGMVTAIECFDSNGEQIVQFFGKRKPGIPELDEWRAVVADLESQFRLAPALN